MTDPVIKLAIKQRDGLLDCAKEFRRQGSIAQRNSARELAELDARACEDAAAMLKKLGTEVTRLRLTIGHFGCGRMNRSDLRKAAETWNDDGQ